MAARFALAEAFHLVLAKSNWWW